MPHNPKTAGVWSLGVILFIMLHASLPFNELREKKLLELQRARRFVFRNHIPRLAKDIVWQLLEIDATLRLTVATVLENVWV
jgi:serine kinase